MISVEAIGDYLKAIHQERAGGVAAYWLEEATSRSELVLQLSTLLSDLPILIVAVSKGAFDDPNS
jgi:hypothetical protein